MNYFEGLVKNTYPINVVHPYETVRNSRIVLPKSQDSTSLNGTLDKYLDKNTLLAITYSNPEIQRLLAEKGIPLNMNLDAFKKHVYNHSVDTKNTAIGIYNNLPARIKPLASLNDIANGAILHDIGKVCIPENILTKKDKLSPKEEDIMHLHSSLSYELLKNQGLTNNVLNIVKYHHQNPSHTGYPDIPESQKIDINSQIVSLADKYSALREKRSYKPQMSPTDAMNIIYEEMKQGVSPDVYNALNNYVMSLQNNTKNATTLTNYLDTKNANPRFQRSTFFA